MEVCFIKTCESTYAYMKCRFVDIIGSKSRTGRFFKTFLTFFTIISYSDIIPDPQVSKLL